MARLKSKEIRKMNNEDINRRIKELRLELVKSRVNANKTGSSKTREAKRTIARMLTINKSGKEELKHK